MRFKNLLQPLLSFIVLLVTPVEICSRSSGVCSAPTGSPLPSFIRQDVIEGFKTDHYAAYTDDQSHQANKHRPYLEPLYNDWKLFLEDIAIQNPNLATGLKSVQEMLRQAQKEKRLSLSTLIKIAFGYAIALGEFPKQAEIDLFSVTYLDKSHKDCREGNFYEVTYKKQYHDEGIAYTPYGIVAETVNKTLRPMFFYPVPGKNVLEPKELLISFLNGVYPLPFSRPESILDVHGIQNITKYGFALHDYAHGEGYRLDVTRALISYIRAQSDLYIQEGGSASDFLDKVAPIIIERHTLITKIFANAIEHFVRENDKKAIMGLFVMLHEYNGWKANIYSVEKNDLCEVFVSFGDNIKKSMESALSDPFETSPITGEKAKSDEVIRAEILEKYKNINSVAFNKIGATDQATQKRFQRVARIDLISNSTATNIFTTFQTGEVKKEGTFPTLLYRLKNIPENIMLLSLGGYSIQNLDTLPSNPIEARRVALEKLAEVKNAISDIVDYTVKKIASSPNIWINCSAEYRDTIDRQRMTQERILRKTKFLN